MTSFSNGTPSLKNKAEGEVVSTNPLAHWLYVITFNKLF